MRGRTLCPVFSCCELFSPPPSSPTTPVSFTPTFHAACFQDIPIPPPHIPHQPPRSLLCSLRPSRRTNDPLVSRQILVPTFGRSRHRYRHLPLRLGTPPQPHQYLPLHASCFPCPLLPRSPASSRPPPPVFFFFPGHSRHSLFRPLRSISRSS